MNRSALITGHTGVIGGALARKLETAGYSITGVSLSGGADIRDFSTLEKTPPPHDALIHCAAAFETRGADSARILEETNIRGTANAARLAQKTSCRHFILISTIFAIQHPENGYFDTPYANSKRLGEDAARGLCREAALSLCILRLPPVYDIAGRSRRHHRFLYSLIDSAITGSPVKIAAAPGGKRNFLLDTDAAQLIARAVEKRIAGEFNVAHPQSHTLDEICAMIQEAAGAPPVLINDSSIPPPPRMFIPRDTSLFELAGFAPGTSLREGIKLTVESELKRLKETGR